MMTEIEPQLAPGDELIEKRLGRWTHAPPALATPLGFFSQVVRRPFNRRHQPAKHIMCPDVAKVQIGRESARRVGVRYVARVLVVLQYVVDEPSRLAGCSLRAASKWHGANLVIDPQVGQSAAAEQSLDVCRWPALVDRVRQQRAERQLHTCQRILPRKVLQVLRQVLLQEPSKCVSRGIVVIGRSQRQQPVGVDHLHFHRQLAGRRRDHAGQKETREFIGHHDARMLRQRLQQPLARAAIRFDIGKVPRASAFQPSRVVCASLRSRNDAADRWPRDSRSAAARTRPAACPACAPIRQRAAAKSSIRCAARRSSSTARTVRRRARRLGWPPVCECLAHCPCQSPLRCFRARCVSPRRAPKGVSPARALLRASDT